MRILHVFDEAGLGGIQRHLLLLLSGFQAHGHAVCLACDPASWVGQAAVAAGIEIFPLKLHGMGDFLALWRLRRLARKWKADIIHGHAKQAAFYARLAAGNGSVCVATAHTTSARHLGRCPHLIAVSHAVAQALVAGGIPATRITIIHNGVPLPPPPESRETLRKELGIPSEAFAVFCAGRFTRDKGQDLLLAAGDTLGVQVVLAGDSAESEFGRQLMARYPHASFIGVRPDIQRLLPAFDFYVAASRREGLSLAVIEAMAAGVPAICTKVGGLPEVVEDGIGGFLAPPEDPSALAEAMRRAMRLSPEARARMGAAARARYRAEFTSDCMVDRTEAYYRSLLGHD